MKVKNVELNIRVKGEGMPFIWGHGLMGSMFLDDSTGFFHSENLTEIAKLIRYDARGHGLSQGTNKPEDYHWSSLAKDMIGIADKLGIDQFIAGGQSMGSMTALYAALMAQERIKALILSLPAQYGKQEKHKHLSIVHRQVLSRRKAWRLLVNCCESGHYFLNGYYKQNRLIMKNI